MPNVACAIGQGASALCLGKRASPEAAAGVMSIFAAVGSVVPVREAQMDGERGGGGGGGARLDHRG
jgi:pyrroline-5-carboxylate reductase